jgi:hypothetical protein
MTFSANNEPKPGTTSAIREVFQNRNRQNTIHKIFNPPGINTATEKEAENQQEQDHKRHRITTTSTKLPQEQPSIKKKTRGRKKNGTAMVLPSLDESENNVGEWKMPVVDAKEWL